jgi:hypothetical protein
MTHTVKYHIANTAKRTPSKHASGQQACRVVIKLRQATSRHLPQTALWQSCLDTTKRSFSRRIQEEFKLQKAHT